MNHGDTEILRTKLNDLSSKVIGAGIEIHRELGPGLLESAYEECLAYSLSKQQVPIPVQFRAVRLDCGYRIDLLVEDMIIVELKAVAEMHPIFEAQLLTYLKLTRKPLGLLSISMCRCSKTVLNGSSGEICFGNPLRLDEQQRPLIFPSFLCISVPLW